MKVIFAGTPVFARVALSAIVGSRHRVALVLTQPDRPSGRGQQLVASPVKEEALAHGLPVLQPTSLRLDGKHAQSAGDTYFAIQKAHADVMVVAAYGLILPQEVLTVPRLGCINIHASLLPRWRGAAPIHRALAAGDAVTGITLMQMERGLDTGPIFCHRDEPIGPDDTTGTVHDRLADLGAMMIVGLLDALERGPVPSTPQPADGITYAEKILKSEARLDFAEDAHALERRIRAFDPAPGAYFEHGGINIKVWRATVVDADAASAPGTISLSGGAVTVRCGRGGLRLDTLQRAGGRRLPTAEFTKGFAFSAGERIA